MLLFGPYGCRQSAPFMKVHHWLQSLQIDNAVRRQEHQRAGIEHVRQRAGIVLRVRRNLGERDVTGLFYEFLELPVRHRRAVDPEAIDRHAMDRRLFGIVVVGSHAERAAGNEDHFTGPARVRRGLLGFGLCLQHRDFPALVRATALLAVVPESLRAGRIGVVPAHARRRCCARPGGSRCGRHHANRGSGRDRAAAWPAIRGQAAPMQRGGQRRRRPGEPLDRALPFGFDRPRRRRAARPRRRRGAQRRGPGRYRRYPSPVRVRRSWDGAVPTMQGPSDR